MRIGIGYVQLTRSNKSGRVEKTDPRSADYPLTPAPRTTLWTTPRATLRTTPTDYPKRSAKFLLRGRKIQEAYLLFLHDQLHDHNCTKNSRHFLFRHFSTQSSPASYQRCFHNGRSNELFLQTLFSVLVTQYSRYHNINLVHLFVVPLGRSISMISISLDGRFKRVAC